MRIVHLLDWASPGAAPVANAALARQAIRRRPDLEHIVVALGPSAARRLAAEAGLPAPIVHIAPPTGKLALAGPAVARAVRACARTDVLHAWSAPAASVARRICPPGARACATILLRAADRARPLRLRAAPPLHALVTPCAEAADRARTARSAAHVVEVPAPRLDEAHPPGDRAALRQALGLGPDDRAALLVGDAVDDDAVRFIIACALTGASGRPLCALLGRSAAPRRRTMRCFERTRALLSCRVCDVDWLALAPAADIGLVVCRPDDACRGTAAAALSLACGLSAGLPVVAPEQIYQRLGLGRSEAGALIAAGWTRAELARIAGPLVDDPPAARAAAAAAAAAQRPGSAFFDAIDEAWAGTIRS
ncbi:MAG: hypothetical protein ACF8R7_05845 [Phycisphaerales bacterium JB039]